MSSSYTSPPGDPLAAQFLLDGVRWSRIRLDTSPIGFYPSDFIARKIVRMLYVYLTSLIIKLVLRSQIN